MDKKPAAFSDEKANMDYRRKLSFFRKTDKSTQPSQKKTEIQRGQYHQQSALDTSLEDGYLQNRSERKIDSLDKNDSRVQHRSALYENWEPPVEIVDSRVENRSALYENWEPPIEKIDSRVENRSALYENWEPPVEIIDSRVENRSAFYEDWEQPVEVVNKFSSLRVFQEPLCLVRNEADGKFSIDDEVLNQISQIDQTVNVIAIAGPYRHGKSYLMNRLARNRHGFALGDGVDAKTKGIWVWCLIHPVYTDQVMVLLDTEGIGDVDKDDSNNDYMLLCISTLISSTFIYNVKGVIDKDTFDKLGFVTYYARKVSVSGEKQVDAYSSDIGLYFPRFVLCLRDFSHNLRGETPNDYLERRLTLRKDSGQESYNQIRACIRKFFLKRECFIFDTPAAGRDNLARLEFMDEKDMLESFIKDSDAFVEKITKYQPKELLDGKRINGNMFSSLVKTYATTFNSGKIPCIDSAMMTMARQENKIVLETVVKEFQLQIRSIELPVCEKNKFAELFNTLRREATKEFRSKCVLQIEEELYDKFEKDMDELWSKHQDENIKLQKSMVISAMEDIYESEIKPRLNGGHYQDVDGYLHYMKDIQSLNSKIKQRFQEMDDTMIKVFLREFKDTHLEDDMIVMRMTDTRKKEIEDEHMRERDKISEDFQRQIGEEQEKYQALINESKKQRALDEENNKIRIEEAMMKWSSENAIINDMLQKEQARVKDLLSILKVEIDANAPSASKSIARGISSFLPGIGSAIFDAVERKQYQKRREELQRKMKQFEEST